MSRKILLSIVALMLVCSMLFNFAEKAPASEKEKLNLPKHISLGATPPGGYYYIFCAGLSRFIEKDYGIKVTVEEFPSSRTYIAACGKNEIQVCFGGSLILEAYQGVGRFKKSGKAAISLLSSGYVSPAMFWTRPDTGITKMEDLAGKKVMYRSPMSATTLICKAYLEYYGLLDKIIDIERPPSARATVQALIEKKCDAMGSPAISALAEIARVYGRVVGIPISQECANAVQEKVPVTLAKIIRPESYPSYKLEGNLYAAGHTVTLLGYKGLSEDTTYAVVKSLYENYDEFKLLHPFAVEWTLQNAVKKPWIPFHNGAIRYYKEKGVWTSQQQKWQDELLAKER